MKRLVCVLLAAVMLCSLYGCNGIYISSYRAIGLVKTNTKSECRAEFSRLDGTCVFRLKNREEGERELRYAASLESGEVNVYYVVAGEKELLVHLSAGETVEGYSGSFEETGKIHVIVETVSPAKGNVEVELLVEAEEAD